MAKGSLGGYSVVSILGVVLGAVVGAGAESALQADSELRREAYLRAHAAHNLWVEGRVERSGRKIDTARYQIAAYGTKDQVKAVRNWMAFEDLKSKEEEAKNVPKEKREFNPIPACQSEDHPEVQFFVAARRGAEVPQFSLFTLLTSIDFRDQKLPDRVVAEVALRCIFR